MTGRSLTEAAAEGKRRRAEGAGVACREATPAPTPAVGAPSADGGAGAVARLVHDAFRHAGVVLAAALCEQYSQSCDTVVLLPDELGPGDLLVLSNGRPGAVEQVVICAGRKRGRISAVGVQGRPARFLDSGISFTATRPLGSEGVERLSRPAPAKSVAGPMLTMTDQASSTAVILADSPAGSEARRAAERGSEAALRAASAWHGLTQTDRLALAELSARYPQVDMAALRRLAPHAVVAMTEHAARGGQVAAVAALLGRCGLNGSPCDRRQAALGMLEAVTSARDLPRGRRCR